MMEEDTFHFQRASCSTEGVKPKKVVDKLNVQLRSDQKQGLVVLYIGLYYTFIWGLLSHYKDPYTNQHFNAQLSSGVFPSTIFSLQATLRFDPTVVKLVLLADLGWFFPRDLGMGWLPLTSTTFSFSTETFDVFVWMIIFGRFLVGCKQQRGRKRQRKAMVF